jgi:predicted membrane protein
VSECEKPRYGLFPILLIVMGALLFLENVGVLRVFRIQDFWPAWLIIWGVFIIDRARHSVLAWIWASALVICGVLLILGNVGILAVRANVIWPVMLMAFGIAWLLAPDEFRTYGERFRERAEARQAERAASRAERAAGRGERRAERYQQYRGWGGSRSYFGNRLNEDIVFSSVSRRLETQQFEGGKMAVVFGSIEIDLSEAGIAPGATVYLKLDTVFGGIDVIVPRTWRVEMRSAAVFGGCDDRTIPPRPELGVEAPKLVVTGAAVFGGITIRH